uniref:30S ribosomal protein S16, chloroplastic n=1 Tax=Fibrocapsa japonica TaxID=94617 RepID=A0A7S2V6U9_9STRA|mmetsp:Transcript_569/g.823  ORF Transcript_569/g.823 Transcript_569/m.823 type:complete len:146 (+) Transcript_569:50-487(+)
MVVRMRLQRFGRTHQPFYRIVTADSRSPRNGKFLEIVGTYNPIASKDGVKELHFKFDRVKYWLGVGAQPSDRVAWLLGQSGLLPPAPRRNSAFVGVAKSQRKEVGDGSKGFSTLTRSVPSPSNFPVIGQICTGNLLRDSWKKALC